MSRGKFRGKQLRRDALRVAKAVLEHRLSEYTLDSTNVKGKL
jgi:hypothetical protein